MPSPTGISWGSMFPPNAAQVFIHEVWSMAVLLETPQVYLDYCNAHLYGKGRKASVDGPSGIVEGVSVAWIVWATADRR